MKNLFNTNLRAISDDRGATSIFLVLAPESETPLWINADRIKLLEGIGDGQVVSFDSRTADGEIKLKKIAMRKGATVMFAAGDKKVGELTIDELKVVGKMLTQPAPTLKEADETRKLEAQKIFG